MLIHHIIEYFEYILCGFALLVGVELAAAGHYLVHPARRQEAVALAVLCVLQPLMAAALAMSLINGANRAIVVLMGVLLVLVAGAALCTWAVLLIDGFLRRSFADADGDDSEPNRR